MPENGLVLVLGMGEVGKPLYNILSRTYRCVGIDIDPAKVQGPCSVMHVCYPFHIKDFVATTVEYIEKYEPTYTVINSTVEPGTTRRVHETSGNPALAYSPVRGKHMNMEQDMLRYKKFVVGFDSKITQRACRHFIEAGFQIDTFRTPEIAELSKLLETTYLGLLIAWAQEVDRFAARYGGTFEETNAYIKEIGFLPSHIFPGPIGGHCVMSNIAILRRHLNSTFLDAIVESNRLKEKQLQPTDSSEKGL